jgi:hypothetical protein
MFVSSWNRRLLYLGLILLILFMSACTMDGSGVTYVVTPEGTLPVDPLFREFYALLGGEDLLGPAISPAFNFANLTFQYTDKACLEYDPSQPEGLQFKLAALGLDLNLSEPAVPPPDDPTRLYVNGHIIFEGFNPLYSQLGAGFVGSPLSELHFNADRNRYEQYFENVGFYWHAADPVDQVHLLSYGAWKCDSNCRFVPELNAKIELESIPPSPSDEFFLQAVARLGADLTGYQITSAYTAADGMIEKIYENVVLAYDPAAPSALFLRPIATTVGVLQGPLAPPSNLPGIYFWPVDSGLGYNVPQPFIDYMNSHGGIDIFGTPMAELSMNDSQVFRQCFTKICLEYHMTTTVPEFLRIRPTPLGNMYREIQERSQNFSVDSDTLNSINLQVWERYQYISYDQEQEIGAAVFDGSTPLEQVVPLLVVTFPDGSQGSYYFPPTSSNGITVFKLDPIDGSKGTIVPYMVCVSMLDQELFCVKDSFVIWYNP